MDGIDPALGAVIAGCLASSRTSDHSMLERWPRPPRVAGGDSALAFALAPPARRSTLSHDVARRRCRRLYPPGLQRRPNGSPGGSIRDLATRRGPGARRGGAILATALRPECPGRVKPEPMRPRRSYRPRRLAHGFAGGIRGPGVVGAVRRGRPRGLRRRGRGRGRGGDVDDESRTGEEVRPRADEGVQRGWRLRRRSAQFGERKSATISPFSTRKFARRASDPRPDG